MGMHSDCSLVMMKAQTPKSEERQGEGMMHSPHDMSEMMAWLESQRSFGSSTCHGNLHSFY
jgi:hypothetical protein